MSNSTDTYHKQGRRWGISITIWLLLVLSAVMLVSGCGKENQTSEFDFQILDLNKTQLQAVDLYVDAEMHVELEENQQAIEKLNAAVGLNDRFSLAFSLLGELYQQQKEYEKSAAS